MKQPAQNRAKVADNSGLAREIESLAESVRRHPELHHDTADRLLALARRLRESAGLAPPQVKRPVKGNRGRGAH